MNGTRQEAAVIQRHATHALTRASATALSIAAILTLTGCGSSQNSAGLDEEPISTGLNALASSDSTLEPLSPNDLPEGEGLQTLIDQTAADLESYFNGQFDSGTASQQNAQQPLRRLPPQPEKPSVTIVQSDPETETQAEPEAETPAEEATQAPEPTTAEQLEASIRSLRTLLRASADEEVSPTRTALALAALTALDGEMPDDNARALLAPAEVAVLNAASELLDQLRAHADEDATLDPERVADLLTAAAQQLAADRPLRISHAALCTRVESFARYNAMPENPGFLAGRSARALVYTEVDGFTSQEVGASSTETESGFKVELSQTLELYHDADGLLAWKSPSQVTTHRSQRPIRDFFVVNRIDLPSSLTIGAYRLKVIMRDAANGTTTETTLPLRVVADPKLTRSARAGR